MATRSTEASPAADVRGSTDLRLLAFSQECALGRSVALITVAMSGAFPLAGGRASGAALMEAVSMVAVAGDIGNHMHQPVELIENLRMEKNTMLHRISYFAQLERKNLARFAVPVLFALSFGCSFAPMFAQQPRQRTFASAEDASRALFDAMQLQDEGAPLSILGTDGKEILSTGDATEDSDTRAGFIVKYQQMHRFVTEPTA